MIDNECLVKTSPIKKLKALNLTHGLILAHKFLPGGNIACNYLLYNWNKSHGRDKLSLEFHPMKSNAEGEIP